MKIGSPQFEKDFQVRLEDWVSRQGLWFQMRHASGSGDVVKSLFGVGVRLVILFLILLGASWFYLTKQVGRPAYNERLKAGMVAGMNASGGQVEGVRRGNASLFGADLMIKRVELKEGKTSFFEDTVLERTKLDAAGNEIRDDFTEGLIAEGITLSPLSLLDGVRGGWTGSELQIQRLRAVLKTTDVSDALAKESYASLFRKYKSLKVNFLDVGKVDLSWGYSEKTNGSLTGASMSGELLNEGWQLVFKGGKLSYGFLKDADVLEARVICRPSGVEIRALNLRVGDGLVSITGDVSVEAKPVVNCKIRLDSVAVEDLVNEEFQSWLGGSVSGEGVVKGDLGAQDGLDIDLKIELSRLDELVVDDEFSLMQTMQFVDAMNSYRRFRFGYGRLRFRTEGANYFVSDLYLRAGIQLYMTGDVAMEKRNKEEITEEVEVEDDEGEVTTDIRVVEAGGMRWYYKGVLEVSLPDGVFARSSALREEFELDDKVSLEDDPERYDLRVDVDSWFDGVTKDLADRIDRVYKKGQKRGEP